jgi:hypothetical protein
VNCGGSFTGNSGTFAEYRVYAWGISLKIHVFDQLREFAHMNTIYIFERIAEGLLAVAATGVTVLVLLA